MLVVGGSGAGKSTLARVLGRRLGLPVVHLDRHFWGPQWTPTGAEEWRAVVAGLAAGDRWVMDGNYGATLDLRLPRAELVVFLDTPRLTCVYRAVTRYWRHRGRVRDDIGQTDRFSWDFLRYVWSYPRRHRPQLLSKIAEHAPETSFVRLRRRRDVDRWLAALASPTTPQPSQPDRPCAPRRGTDLEP